MNLCQCFLKLSQIEEGGAEFYRKFSELSSEEMKHVAISFAQEEYKHRKMMIDFSRNDDFSNIYLDDDTKESIRNQSEYADEEKMEIGLISEKEFFKFSLQMEKNSIEIYERLQNMIEKDSTLHGDFEALINEEKKHMIFIMKKLYEKDQ